MSGGRLPKRIMFGNLEGAVRRGRGGKEKEWTDCVQTTSELLIYDSITVSSTWELTSVSMRYSQGDGVNTSLSRLVYCTHV